MKISENVRTNLIGALIVSCMACLLFGSIWAVTTVAPHDCKVYHDATGAETKMIEGSCFVNDQGRWVTLHSYINRN